MSDTTANEIVQHYASGYEVGRLASGTSRLELLRTRELIARYLPPPPATILDVGGGPGIHALWLASLGYDVHLVDIVPLHIEQARAAQWGNSLASTTVGDARALEAATGSVDAVLLMGPLYHLTEDADRLQALREALRVTKTGGWLFAAGISRFASLFDGVYFGFLEDPEFRAIVAQDLASGQHRNPGNHPAYFMSTYFHHPEDLRREVAAPGWDVQTLVGIEGPGAWATSLASPALAADHLIEAARAIEAEPTLLGLSPHLMVVARRP
jgi:ubiquinone/menaquinone biosynthesis C-methylase UbiE